MIALPEGWVATSLPEPTMVQGAGFRFTTTSVAKPGEVVLTSLLELVETRFTGARTQDFLELARSVAAKDERKVVLSRK